MPKRRRAYFRHVWQCRSEGNLRSLHEGLLPDDAYAGELPADIRQDCTGVPVIDQAVRTLYTTGMLHNPRACGWPATWCICARCTGTRRVRCIDEPHLAPWLAQWAGCEVLPALFPPVDRRCDSFSQWWARATRGLGSAADLLAVNEVLE